MMQANETVFRNGACEESFRLALAMKINGESASCCAPSRHMNLRT